MFVMVDPIASLDLMSSILVHALEHLSVKFILKRERVIWFVLLVKCRVLGNLVRDSEQEVLNLCLICLVIMTFMIRVSNSILLFSFLIVVELCCRK